MSSKKSGAPVEAAAVEQKAETAKKNTAKAVKEETGAAALKETKATAKELPKAKAEEAVKEVPAAATLLLGDTQVSSGAAADAGSAVWASSAAALAGFSG